MKPGRIALIVLSLIAVGLFWYQYEKTYEDRGLLTVRQETGNPDAVVFAWASRVAVPMERRLSEAFETWKDRVGTIIIDLHSPGGALIEGRAVIETIDRMKRTHRIVTRVRPRRACLSMCVPIFLRGHERLAAANSAWMFHEPRRIGTVSGETASEPEFERRYYSRRFFNRYFVNSPMDARWRRKLEAEWQGKDVWFTGQELVDQNAGIVTGLL